MGCTGETLRTYRADLQWFLGALESSDLKHLTTETVEQILAQRRNQVRPVTAHRTYRTLRAFCHWCAATGRFATDPMAGMRVRVPTTLPCVPSDDDVRALLRECADTLEGRRNRLLVALAADSALRKEELRRLQIDDLDQVTRRIRVVAGKGRKDGIGFLVILRRRSCAGGSRYIRTRGRWRSFLLTSMANSLVRTPSQEFCTV